jgi:hypothetical protein
MRCRYRLFLSALVVGVAVAATAMAGVPDPNLSIVKPVIISPGANIAYTVDVESAEGPVDQALVQILFSTESAGLLCWCNGQAQPLIQGTTNASGLVTFFVAGGGCIDPTMGVTPPVAQIFANGTLLKEVGVKSPDAVDTSGLKPAQGWNPGSSCTVGLTDATYFTGPIKTGTYDYCADIDSDNVVGILDAVAVTAPIKLGNTCTKAP